MPVAHPACRSLNEPAEITAMSEIEDPMRLVEAGVVVTGVITNEGGQTNFNLTPPITPYPGHDSTEHIAPEVALDEHERTLKGQLLSKRSGAWLFDAASEGPSAKVFQQWLTLPAVATVTVILWLTALPAWGKSVLFALIIRHLRNRIQSATISKDTGSQASKKRDIGLCFEYLQLFEQPTAEQILRSLLRRLIKRLDSANPRLEDFRRSSNDSDFKKVLRCMQDVCGEFGDGSVVLIDGLEGCTEEERVQLIKHLKKLPNTKVLVTSRNLPSIAKLLKPCFCISPEPQEREPDVHLYIEKQKSRHPGFQQLVSNSCGDLSGSLEGQMDNAVLSNSGCFLAMNRHVENLIAQRTQGDLRKAMLHPPNVTAEIRDGTFQHLREQMHSPADWDYVKKIVIWTYYGEQGRPFSYEQLAYLVGFQPDTETPELEHKNILSAEDMVNLCQGLIVHRPESNLLMPAHGFTRLFWEDETNRVEHFPDAYEYLLRVSIAHLRAASRSEESASHPRLGTDPADQIAGVSSVLASKLRVYIRLLKEHSAPLTPTPSGLNSDATKLASMEEVVVAFQSDKKALDYTLRAFKLANPTVA